jgi:hypothetical protein
VHCCRARSTARGIPRSGGGGREGRSRDFHAHLAAARIYAASGKHSLAWQALDQALALSPGETTYLARGRQPVLISPRLLLRL